MTTESSRTDALTYEKVDELARKIGLRIEDYDHTEGNDLLDFVRAILAAPPVEQPAVAPTPNAYSFGEYRRGLMEAFHFVNMANANRQGRTAEETCTHIVSTLAKLANGEHPVPAPADEWAAFNADDLDFEPNAQHTVADMANIGYALLEQISRMMPGYHWNDSPVEIVSDLINERDETRAVSANETK